MFRKNVLDMGKNRADGRRWLFHRRSHFDQISVRIVEADDFLPPTVGHEPVYIPDGRVQGFQLPDKGIKVTFFKVQFAGVVLRNGLSAEKFLPDRFVLQHKTFGQDQVAVLVKQQFETEQVVVKFSGSFQILHDDQYIFQFHLSLSPLACMFVGPPRQIPP